MPFVKVCTVQEVPAGQGKQVTVNGCKIALFNIGGTYYAIDDSCPHRGGSLSQGALAGTEVVCPLHGARFALSSGAHLSPPARTGVRSYQVQVVGDEVLVDAP